MKIYDWKKFLTFIAIVLLFVLIALHQCSNVEHEVERIEEYEVKSGETIWSIATDNLPKFMSIQEYVYEIRELNHENDCILMVGQKLQIPIYKEV